MKHFATALETALATTPPDRVRLDDLVAVTALLTKTPETWAYLAKNVEHATVHPWLAVSVDAVQKRKDPDREAVRTGAGLLEATPKEHRPVVQRFMEQRLDRLAMAQNEKNARGGEGWQVWSNRLRSEGRIAEREILETVLAGETTTPATVEREARKAFELLDSAERLRLFLESIPSQRLENVIQALEGHRPGFRAEHARRRDGADDAPGDNTKA